MRPRWAAALLILMPGIAQAQPFTSEQMNKALSLFYATATLDTSSGCRAELIMNADALQSTNMLDTLKQKGEINANIPDATYQDKPGILISFLGQQDAKSLVFMTYYGGRPVDLCHFEIAKKATYQGGQQIEALLFSFDFNRALFGKLDWSQFLAISLPDIASNYRETLLFHAYEVAASVPGN